MLGKIFTEKRISFEVLELLWGRGLFFSILLEIFFYFILFFLGKLRLFSIQIFSDVVESNKYYNTAWRKEPEVPRGRDDRGRTQRKGSGEEAVIKKGKKEIGCEVL